MIKLACKRFRSSTKEGITCATEVEGEFGRKKLSKEVTSELSLIE